MIILIWKLLELKNNNLFDLPICGTYPVINNMSGDNFDLKSKIKWKMIMMKGLFVLYYCQEP